MDITINEGSSLYGHEGYFNWKHRYLGSEIITASSGFSISANYRVMRYAEVLLLAAEAAVESGDNSSALNYINMVRERAELPALDEVTLEDIKKEKRLELAFEQVRYQDLIRWGDAAVALGNQYQKIPVFYGLADDGSFDVQYPYENSRYGFQSGRNELLPIPEHEINVNQNITQNPGW